jgi:hypothetical protein
VIIQVGLVNAFWNEVNEAVKIVFQLILNRGWGSEKILIQFFPRHLGHFEDIN